MGDDTAADPVPHLVVDADPGIDDVLALLALAHHHLAGRLVLDLVTTVGGNTLLARAAANARWALDVGGLGSVPVAAGAAMPLGGQRRGPVHTDIHGADGVGGWFPADRPVPEPTGDGVAALVAALRPGGGRPSPWLLATGPLTDLALALEAEPSLTSSVERVVVMGGAFGDPPGTSAEGAEFNVGSDPFAARQVLRSGLVTTLVPLDITAQVLFGPADADDLERRSGGPTTASRLLRSSIESNGRERGLPGAPVHDALAAAVVVAPSLATTEDRRLDVVTEGPAAGRVVPADDGPIVPVVVDVDAGRAKALLLAAWASTT